MMYCFQSSLIQRTLHKSTPTIHAERISNPICKSRYNRTARKGVDITVHRYHTDLIFSIEDEPLEHQAVDEVQGKQRTQLEDHIMTSWKRNFAST